MPARSVCLVALSLSEAGPGRFGRQVSVIDIYHTIHTPPHPTSHPPPLQLHATPAFSQTTHPPPQLYATPALRQTNSISSKIK